MKSLYRLNPASSAIVLSDFLENTGSTPETTTAALCQALKTVQHQFEALERKQGPRNIPLEAIPHIRRLQVLVAQGDNLAQHVSQSDILSNPAYLSRLVAP